VETVSQSLEKQVFLIAPGVYHFPHSCSDDLERFSLSFSPAEGELLEKLQEICPRSTVFSLTSDMEELCMSLFRELAKPKPFSEEMQKLLIAALMIAVFRHLQMGDLDHGRPLWGNERSDTVTIDTFFEQHFAEKVSREMLAECLNLSQRQLSRVLQSHYGMSFQEKLVQTRMDHAAALLRSSDKSVGEIIGLVGYASEPAFFELFRRQFGVTPLQYRRKYQEEYHKDQKI